MNKPASHKVSHYWYQQPVEAFWSQLPYLTVVKDSEPMRYSKGKGGRGLYSEEDIAALCAVEQLIALKPWAELENDESLYLTPRGEVVVAKKNLGPKGPCKIVSTLPGAALLSGDVQYEDLGIKPSWLIGLPDETRLAAQALRIYSQRIGGEIAKETIRHNDEYQVFDCRYPEFETKEPNRLNLFNQFVLAAFREIITDTRHTQDLKSLDAHFDLANWVPDRMAATLLSFPFYLSPERRDRWGVIPFAQQREIGVLVHKNHPAMTKTSYGKWKETEIEPTKTLRARSWLVDLIYAVSQFQDGKIITFRGYIFGEIINIIVAAATQENARKVLSGVMIEETPRSAKLAGIPNILSKRQKVGSVFFFDPAEKRYVEQALRDRGSPRLRDYQIEILPHGVNVPAGIGFSLFSLPILLKESRLSRILARVGAAVAGLKNDFREAGLELIAHADTIMDQAGLGTDIGETIADDAPVPGTPAVESHLRSHG